MVMAPKQKIMKMSTFLKKSQGMAWSLFLLLTCSLSILCRAQDPSAVQLDKMPVDLETAFALSSLPPDLRAGATVYLNDPSKGLYVARQGTNGFVCFISRSEWEWGKFRNDFYAPMGFDPEGARIIFPMYKAVADMRASGKFTYEQIRDSIISGIRKGVYKAPPRSGLCYMLAPIMRVYGGTPDSYKMVTVSMPHYMFYAPYAAASDMGLDPNSPGGPWVVNPGSSILGEHKGPYGLIIVPARQEDADKIRESNKDLLKRLADYSPYLKVDAMAAMHH
jgi:hypothetical protein